MCCFMEKPISELLEFCIINVDKPAGITSFVCADKVRKILGAKKAGHFGTLDPIVTGVLPMAFNRATRLSNYFMKKDKEYIGKMLLHRDITIEELEKEMENFIGNIMQKPPVKSRVKRVLREREVKKFKIIKKEGRIVEFESDVQAGTYIRKLISDLGEKIGGAHMIELRRIRAGLFSVKEESVKGLLNGKPLMQEDVLGKIPNSELFSAFCKERFIGIYQKINPSLESVNPEDSSKQTLSKNNEEKVDKSVNENIIGKAEFVLN